MKLRSGKIIQYSNPKRYKPPSSENIKDTTCKHNEISFKREFITFSILSSSIILLTSIFNFKDFFQNISINDIKFTLFHDM